jgi:hypothetical protein
MKEFHKILQYQMILSVCKLFGNRKWVIQQDNDPKHKEEHNQNYLRNKGGKVMKWPHCSPDLNPIDNLCKILDDITSKRKPKIENELFKILNDTWKHMDKDYLKKLVKSMPPRYKQIYGIMIIDLSLVL